MAKTNHPELRNEIIDVCRRMNALGINQGTSGNVSARIDGGLLITPSGVPYDDLLPEQIVEMDAEGRYVGEYLPSSEWRMHYDIIRKRPEAGAVVHTHAVHCTALSCLRIGIPAFHYMIAVAGGTDIRCSDYATYGTQALSDTTAVGANIAGSVPLVGDFMKTMLLGGDGYNPHTLPRFFVLHAAVLPTLLTLLVIVHIAIIRMQGVTEFEFADEPKDKPKTFSFFPDHMMSELIIGLLLMSVLTALACIAPAMMGPRADPLVTPEVIKPEWFFYVAFRWLKIFPGTFAVLSTGFIVFVMFAWPFIDERLRRRTPGSEISVWIGIFGVLAIVALTLWEAVVAH